MDTKPESIAASRDASGALARARWLALIAALLGWMFDGAEMGVFSMVGRPAIKDLLRQSIEAEAAGIADPVEAAKKAEAKIGRWFAVIMACFLVGAATGGVLFGWLGDRIGRVRAMTLSVFTYAFFTGLCGVAASAWQVGVLRFIAALGMGGEWSLGVALVMEVWPNRSRAFMAGLIGAAANVGYLLVGVTGLGLATILGRMKGVLLTIGFSESIAGMLVANSGWRIMMILGTLPALLTFFIRVFVPESERWEQEKGRGATSHWAVSDLLGIAVGMIGPLLIIFVWAPVPSDNPNLVPLFGGLLPVSPVAAGWIRVVGTLLGMVVVTVGYTWPLVRFLQRQDADLKAEHRWRPTLGRMLLAAGLSGVALLGTWGSTQWAPSWADKLAESDVAARSEKTGEPPGPKPHYKEHTQIWLAIGAIVGTILAALAGDAIGRRWTYFLLCVGSLVSVFLFFLGNTQFGVAFLFWTFVTGGMTATFYGWLPLYLPELFRTSIRATGQGFGFNFGRILAAVGVLQTGALMSTFSEGMKLGPLRLPGGYPAACSVMSLIYLVGMLLIWFAPETKGQQLPE